VFSWGTLAPFPTSPVRNEALPMFRLFFVLLLMHLLSAAPGGRAAADDTPGPLTPWQLRAAVAQKPSGNDLERLRQQVYATFGKKDLEAGTARPKVEDSLACFAIALPEKPESGGVPRLIQTDGSQRWDMIPIGEGADVYLFFAEMPNPGELNYAYEVGSRRTGAGQLRVESYNYGPESLPQDGVPKGTITKFEWKSKIFPDTVRDYLVYVPAQYDPNGPPACVMVFQDGATYLGNDFRAATVFDNLIHKKEIPPLIGIFINPGVVTEEGKPPRSNRSVEYDTLSDAYARFLRDEILPEVGAKYHLREDAASRAVCGISSGGICAFTVAWEMPNQFGKVLSHVGSFTNIRGGHVYPALIRKLPKKDIRVYLQANAKDLDNEFGNWPLANQEMALALKFKGNDFTFVMGPGFHSGKFGGAHLPEELKWLWRDYHAPQK
jgi:enterochelin esterase family protein